MEEILAPTTTQARKSGDGHQTQEFNESPKHTSLNKNMIRKKSLFKLAAEFFKPNKAEKPEILELECENREDNKSPRNSCVSMRGLRDSGKTAAGLETPRARSLSPQKCNAAVIDEFGAQKARRRKSLQDLLGTVGRKLPLVRRPLYSEDSTSQVEAPSEVMSKTQGIPPLVLPEPALPLSGPPDAALGSLYLYSKDSQPSEVLNAHGDSGVRRDDEEIPCGQPKLQAKPSLCTLNVAAQPTNAVEESTQPKLQRKPQDINQISRSPSPERPCPALATNDPQDVSQQVAMRVRFADENDPPQYNYTDNFEATIALENRNLYPPLPERAHGGETNDNENNLPITATKITKNLRQSSSSTEYSMDSSETDTENMSDYAWVQKESEVHDIIGRGKEMMTLGTLSPCLHSDCPTFATNSNSMVDESHKTLRNGAFSSHCCSNMAQRCPTDKEDRSSSVSYVMCPLTSEEPSLESATCEELTMTGGSLQGNNGVKAQTITRQVNRRMTRAISLEKVERFRPARENSRIYSGEPVHVVYPCTELSEAHTKTYLSKSCAFADLFQNHSGFSNYCLFDRNTRTYYPQVQSNTTPDLPQFNNERLEALWLPMEMFPVDSPAGQADRDDGSVTFLNDRTAGRDKSSSYRVAGVSDPAPSPLQASDAENSKNVVSNEAKPTALNSSRHDSCRSEHSTWVGFTDSAPHDDNDDVSHLNYTTTLISTREVFSSTSGSVISDDPQPGLDHIDDPYEIAIDPADARLYLGSQFSSSQSLRSIAETEDTCSNSADSMFSKLKDTQLENAKSVKTWMDLEREYLDKFAPGIQLFLDRRRRVAVYEAIKKLKGVADLSYGDDVLQSSDSDSGFENEPDTQQRQWQLYRDEYMGFSFEYVEDITGCRSTAQEPVPAASPSYIPEDCNLGLRIEPITVNDARCEDESFELGQRDNGRSVTSTTFRDRSLFGDLDLEQQIAKPELSISDDLSKNHGFDNGKHSFQESDIVSLGSQKEHGSEAYSDTESTAITKLSGYMFTHYSEQLGECPTEIPGESNNRREERGDQSIRSAVLHRPTDIAPILSSFESVHMQTPAEQSGTGAGVTTNTEQTIRPKNENIGQVRTVNVQVCPSPSIGGVTSVLPGRMPSLKAGDSSSAEFLSGLSSKGSRSAVGKRVLTPKKRISSSLTELPSQASQILRWTSPSPSDADTEESENFGEKLKRYRPVDEEDDKENDFWWRDSISYG